MRKINGVRGVLLAGLVACLPILLSAQDGRMVRGDCLPSVADEGGATRGVRVHLPALRKEWDANKTYKQMVVLLEFSDTTFNRENPHDDYNRIFNEPGYNEGKGVGCVADYFREQSGGLFNLEFDVYGPVTVSSKAQPFANPTSSSKNYGGQLFREATQKVLEQHPDADYTQYDWNGDGVIEQVIYVFAGPTGNQGDGYYGHIWPNASTFTTLTTPDGCKISQYSASGEHWRGTKRRSFGIGTICHEYSHCLGLPDIYPVNGWVYSAVDEFDLMDGGNYTNYGWCPCNYTPLEKMLLGWLTPVELTKDTTIVNLRSVSDGGETYLVRHTNSEYYLLENRQWSRWDAGLPGRGLVVYHVDFNSSTWTTNAVNNTTNHLRFSIVNADNMTFDAWDKLLQGKTSYQNADRMNSQYLSTSPYPYSSDTIPTVNNLLTDDSTPASVMFNANAEDSRNLSKPITNIRMSDDGLVTFDFMGGTPDAIQTVPADERRHDLYDLYGRKVLVPKKGLYIVNGRKVMIN